jgi:hypothetical protein
MKHRIQRDFFGDEHYVWCSEVLDCSKLNKYARGAAMPASSDPYQIYKDLDRIIRSNDRHGAKIVEQRKNLTALAVEKASVGLISEDDRDLIAAIVAKAELVEFAPRLFLISTPMIAGRAKLVDPSLWAGTEREWILPDLRPGEFDIVELGL